MNCSGVRIFTVELLWTVFDKLMPPPTHLPTPSATLTQNWCETQTSKLCYNKFNRLISPVLQISRHLAAFLYGLLQLLKAA